MRGAPARRPWGGLLRLGPVRSARFWLAFWALWTANALLFSGAWMLTGVPPRRAVQIGFLDQYSWALLCLALFALAWRRPLLPERWRRDLPGIVAWATALALARAVLLRLASLAAFGESASWGRIVSSVFPHHLAPTLGLMCGVYALDFFQRFREREMAAARLEAQLSQARLDVLKIQLHPHFLFNTFNSVSTLMYRDVDAAERTLDRLADMLRQSLEHTDRQEVPLAEELRFVRLYLEIEQTRYGDRLRVEWRVEPEAGAAAVPHLLLQPLVENAIRHGIAPRRGPGRVAVRASRRGGRLELEVRDDGRGLPPGWSFEAAGVGLANTRARLEQLYGAEQEMEVGPAPGGGTRVFIRIPFRPAPAVSPLVVG